MRRLHVITDTCTLIGRAGVGNQPPSRYTHHDRDRFRWHARAPDDGGPRPARPPQPRTPRPAGQASTAGAFSKPTYGCSPQYRATSRPHCGGETACENVPPPLAIRGADRSRTGVRGFAGPCLTTRPPRRSHHGTPALACKFAGLPGNRQNEWPPSDANLVPGLMPRRSAGAPDPYRGSAFSVGVCSALNSSKDSLKFC
jgi:hypothetical protein